MSESQPTPPQSGRSDTNEQQRIRSCGYSGCDRTIAYSGRGRPREYCDRVWPDGEGCQQKAEAERVAATAAGLDGPLIAYRQVTETTRPVLEGLASQLTELLDTVRAVETGALERIAAAEITATEASERATRAEHDRDTAVSRANVADQQRRAATEAQRIADRRARDAEKEAEDTKLKAWREIADHENKRGKAESAAEESKANLKAFKERFDKLAKEHDALLKQNKELTRATAAAEKAQALAEAARTAAESATATAEQERGTALTKRDEHAEKATAATTRAEQAEAKADELRRQMDDAQTALAGVRDRAQDAENQRDRLAEQLAAARQRTTDRDAEIDRLREELNAAQTRANAAPTHEQIAEMIRAAVHPHTADDPSAEDAGTAPDDQSTT